jgi:hypothetical protein
MAGRPTAGKATTWQWESLPSAWLTKEPNCWPLLFHRLSLPAKAADVEPSP